MGAVKSTLSRLKAATLGQVAARRATSALSTATFSMTFDDVPRSAVEHGVPVLLDHHAEATFDVSAGLTPAKGYLDPSDIEALRSHGFNVACHTHSHYRLKHGTSRGLAVDAERNRAAFEGALHLPRTRDFAYPCGEVNAAAKHRIGKDYATAHSVYPGINDSRSDLLLLRANPLFTSSVDWDDVRRLLDDAAEANAWVIFYTHGVDPNPDERSCVPDDLGRLLDECHRAGLAVRSVRSVSEELVPGWTPGQPDQPGRVG